MPDPGPLRVRRRTTKGASDPVLLRWIYPNLTAKTQGAATVPLQPAYYKLTDSETPYFDYFRVVVATDLGTQTYGVSEFWHRTVLRDALQNRFVLDAVIAIGALSRAVKSRTTGYDTDCNTSLDNGDYHMHYSRALVHYARALAKYRSLLAKESTATVAPRKILIATLLVTVFEAMQGNAYGVDAFTAKGILVLKDVIMRTKANSTTSHAASALDDQGVEDAEFYLARRAAVASLLSPLYPQSKRSVMHFRQFLDESPSPPELSQNMDTFNSVYMRFLTLTLIWLNRLVDLTASAQLAEMLPKYRLEQKVVISKISEWLGAVYARLHATPDPSQDPEADPKDWVTLQLIDIGTKLCYVSAVTFFDPSRKELSSHQYTGGLVRQLRLVLKTKVSSPYFQRTIHERLAFSAANLARECRDSELRTEIIDLSMEIADLGISADMKAALLGYLTLAKVEDGYRDKAGCLPEAMQHDWTSAFWDKDHTVLHITITARYPTKHNPRLKKFALRARECGLR
ncbi:hypothetical protein BKA67DRAFT_536942 [Truncatella angustata]|uniref:Uncharacterized protein n=1 Tax=Truncatella angustata TaxID=152316 RepID=A0A9P8UJQ6_9PEZI|nr:uncharacterized protein BKA67DRAFT_536942 [Truncatella angustata]KAH6653255.1 hypothetical protein BKA67DRAFT_536942 [Truncatella angustata]